MIFALEHCGVCMYNINVILFYNDIHVYNIDIFAL